EPAGQKVCVAVVEPEDAPPASAVPAPSITTNDKPQARDLKLGKVIYLFPQYPFRKPRHLKHRSTGVGAQDEILKSEIDYVRMNKGSSANINKSRLRGHVSIRALYLVCDRAAFPPGFLRSAVPTSGRRPAAVAAG